MWSLRTVAKSYTQWPAYRKALTVQHADRLSLFISLEHHHHKENKKESKIVGHMFLNKWMNDDCSSSSYKTHKRYLISYSLCLPRNWFKYNNGWFLHSSLQHNQQCLEIYFCCTLYTNAFVLFSSDIKYVNKIEYKYLTLVLFEKNKKWKKKLWPSSHVWCSNCTHSASRCKRSFWVLLQFPLWSILTVLLPLGKCARPTTHKNTLSHLLMMRELFFQLAL